jgi:nephrocystin-4
VQKQLLTDVSSVRARQKHALIKEQLRRNLVISRVIRPGYGEVVVYEHEFANPFAQEMVSRKSS